MLTTLPPTRPLSPLAKDIGVEQGRSLSIGSALTLLHPCSAKGCLLHPEESEDYSTPPLADSAVDLGHQSLTPLLIHTAQNARWRRAGSVGNNLNRREVERNNQKKIQERQSSLKDRTMEEVHGVDVSWLHQPKKGGSEHHQRRHTTHNVDAKRDVKAATNGTQNGALPQRNGAPPVQTQDLHKLPSPPIVTPPTPVEPAQDSTQAVPLPANARMLTNPNKRPSLLDRNSSERVSRDGKSGSKRQSWMNSISSKFSSQGGTTPERASSTPPPAQRQPPATNPSAPTNGAPQHTQTIEEAEAYVPAKPKDSASSGSFFSGIARRLSSTQSSNNIPKVQGAGSVCPRRVLNLDPNRERCLIPEMDPGRLRKVSFCVDVEIAGGPRYRDDDEDDEERKRKKKEFKMKERAEGEALKRPEALKEEKDEEESKSKPTPDPSEKATDPKSIPQTEEERDSAARKREKKQKSEVERKERKEKRRKRAEENGSIPVELSLDGEGDDNMPTISPPTLTSAPPKINGVAPPSSTPNQPPQAQPNAEKQNSPTTDPARIYRRCCQLRESPILKRITEQLSKPSCVAPTEPGIVNCLDLTGSRLQLADVISLGDWLAVVPVRVLKLENADLNDEGVRCILAGLLAAKKPEPTKRRSTVVVPRHREGVRVERHQERAGVIEKITLKNNPRLTRVAWKHISLFLYMCRSLRAIDVSGNQFPDTLPSSAQPAPVKGAQTQATGSGEDLDAAEALYKCLSERLGGSKLEELILSECSLSSAQIRKVVDGAMVCGISRLGLAGNRLDDEGLEHAMRFLRSGICQALDLGSNDLRGRLQILADALTSRPDLPTWGLSLSDCNLDSASMKPLFPALASLKDFRFVDFSHNPDLCVGSDNGLINLLRRYLAQLKNLKRLHLADVNMSPKQAIALADLMPEGPRLAHVSLMENPQLAALADAKSEEEQEEACALYASLMAAVRCSRSLICLDIDVPSAESSEVVKALAKQIVAYSLRNMEQFAIEEMTGISTTATTNATTALTGPYGGEKGVKEITVPDVLMHLVGHVEGNSENHDNDAPAPDEDYVIGGTGVVKALQYVLSEKGAELHRNSLPSTPTGDLTPGGNGRPGSSAGVVEPGKAKKVSKSLLNSARKIRARLQPALAKEAGGSDEMAYRRLLFLDQTLQSMIARFEEEYPETRLDVPERLSPSRAPSQTSTASLTDRSAVLSSSINTQTSADFTNASLSDDELDAADDDYHPNMGPSGSRKGSASDVGLASRALIMEEGHIHRLGQSLRRNILSSPTTSSSGDVPWKEAPSQSELPQSRDERLRKFGERVENITGMELQDMISNKESYDHAMREIGGTYEQLRALQEEDPEAWELFKEAQETARRNVERASGR